MPDRPRLDDVELISPRLLLRPWREADAPAVFEAMQDRRMHEFLPLPDPYTTADAIAFASEIGNGGRPDGTGLGCAVVERTSNTIIGSADLRYPIGKLLGADIGYAIYPNGQGNGYAAEAARALTEWGHAQGLNRIEIRCAVTNLASAATALAAGFTFEGVGRAQLAIGPVEFDTALFARLAGDDGAPIHSSFPRIGALEDDEVRLRMLGAHDSEAYWEQESDADSLRFGLRSARPAPAEIAARTQRAGFDRLVGSSAELAVEERSTGAYAGTVRVRLAGPPQVGRVGYAIHPAFRGRGYATRAVRLLAGWAFADAGLARLELGAKVANIASQRVALAAGFIPDGVRRARLRNLDGTFSDEARFALLRDEVGPRRS